MNDEFTKKQSELIRSDSWNGFLGIKRGAQFHTKAGVSSMYSDVFFLTEVEEGDLSDVPDYILSDTIQKDLTTSVVVCGMGLKETKYLPDLTQIGGQMGAVPEGEHEGAYLRDWKDFEIEGCNGEPVYSEEVLEGAIEAGEDELATALWLVVKDICDSGGFLSQDWYMARILFEYFRCLPVLNDSAYLIGELYKELCAKQQFEGDLAFYYQSLSEAQQARLKGSNATKEKAEELRLYCVGLFAELYKEAGPRLLLAPDEMKAEELMRLALRRRPQDFQRAGKPYRKEWFLRHVIEDRRLEIIQAVEAVKD